MKIGKAGKNLIKQFESLKFVAYLPTPEDVWTIGYGHTKGVKRGDVITEVQAELFLLNDLVWAEEAVNRYILVDITQNQFDALVSFVFNVGVTAFKTSTLTKILNYGQYTAAADQLLRWDKQAGKVLRGLTRRRIAERALFLS